MARSIYRSTSRKKDQAGVSNAYKDSAGCLLGKIISLISSPGTQRKSGAIDWKEVTFAGGSFHLSRPHGWWDEVCLVIFGRRKGSASSFDPAVRGPRSVVRVVGTAWLGTTPRGGELETVLLSNLL